MQLTENKLPIVSVIIPCRNEERFIGTTVGSFVASDYPKDRLEVLVVDGMSQDSTRTVIESFVQQHPFIRLVDNPRKITPAAMNVGIKAARGAVIVIASAHTEYPSDFIRSCVDCLKKTGADVVGGPVITKPGADTITGKAIALARSHPFGVGNSRFRISRKDGYVDTVPFGAYRREVFDQVGLFDGRLVRNQDNEMNDRIVRSGRKIYLTNRLTTCYFNQATLSGFLKHAISVGMWNVRTIAITPSALRWRHFVPVGFVTALVMLGSIGIFSPWVRMAFVALVGLYSTLAAICSLQIGLTRGDINASLLPPIFFLYHAAYGIGGWAGLIMMALQQSRRLVNFVFDTRRNFVVR